LAGDGCDLHCVASQQINDLASRILRCGAACRHQRETKWEPQRETHRCQQVVGRIAGNDQPQELSVQKMRLGTRDGQESEQGVQRQSNCKLSRASKTGAVPRRERQRCRRNLTIQGAKCRIAIKPAHSELAKQREIGGSSLAIEFETEEGADLTGSASGRMSTALAAMSDTFIAAREMESPAAGVDHGLISIWFV
jgi:hypothetical protein